MQGAKACSQLSANGSCLEIERRHQERTQSTQVGTMYFTRDKASLRLNVLLEARGLPKIGCAQSGLSCKTSREHSQPGTVVFHGNSSALVYAHRRLICRALPCMSSCPFFFGSRAPLRPYRSPVTKRQSEDDAQGFMLSRGAARTAARGQQSSPPTTDFSARAHA